MNCFASPPCKMPNVYTGNGIHDLRVIALALTLKLQIKQKQIMMLSIWSEYKSHAIYVLRCICTLF